MLLAVKCPRLENGKHPDLLLGHIPDLMITVAAS